MDERGVPKGSFGRHRKIMPFEPGSIEATARRLPRRRRPRSTSTCWAMARRRRPNGGGRHCRSRSCRRCAQYRLERIRAELKRRDYAGALLYDPVNIRYATDSTNMQLWVAHNPTRHCFVATEGPVVLFDYFSCEHLSDHSGVVDEVRPAVSWMYLYGGELTEQTSRRWAAGIADLVRRTWRRQPPHRGRPSRSAKASRNSPASALPIGNGEAVMENARLIKSPDEILCHAPRHRRLRGGDGRDGAALKPGISENELWAELHRGNIARGGEWIETRLLSSGPRTNPWFQECSSRIIEAGDLVAFDTDLIGPYGFCADLSRTWLCGDGKPTQRAVATCSASPPTRSPTTRALMQPGISLPRSRRTLGRTRRRDCFPTRYGVLYHGVGLADEYPTLPHAADWTDDTPDGVLEPGMVLCVESYIGRLGGREGVKIEEQILITETGNEQLSNLPAGCEAARLSLRAS